MRLLDLFCGAGGSTRGFQNAGFVVVGVDNRPQPHYVGDDFIQGDALQVMRVLLAGKRIRGRSGRWYRLADFDVFAASPPCQGYSRSRTMRGNIHPDLIGPTRDLLKATGKPYIIENVVGAPLKNPTLLCGSMFGLGTYRHRLFETSFELPFLMDYGHGKSSDKLTGPSSKRAGEMVVVVGKPGYKGAARRYREAMGIDWANSHEISQAVPPAFTEWLGRRLLEHIGDTA